MLALKHIGGMVQRWAYGQALAVDMWGCALFGGAPMETFSARFYQNRNRWGAPFMRATDYVMGVLFGQQNHCEGAWIAYQARIKAAPVWSG